MCSNPYVVNSIAKGVQSTSKKFLSKESYIAWVQDVRHHFTGQMLPCHRCLECRMKYSSDWAKRVALQLKSQPNDNWFITFTYSDSNLKYNEKGLPIIDYTDFQKFMKRLRKKYGREIKYLCAGEYGTKSGRPHFHALIFGLKLEDLKETGELNYEGSKYYISKDIDKIWGLGTHIIGELNYKTASYTTRYSLKKMRLYDYGELGIPPEKLLLSKGIGKEYFDENWQEIYRTDKVYFKNGDKLIKSTPPLYYDRLMYKMGLDSIVDKNKEQRDFLAKNRAVNDWENYDYNVQRKFETKKDYLKEKLRKLNHRS